MSNNEALLQKRVAWLLDMLDETRGERDEAARNIYGVTVALRTQIKRADKYQSENSEMRETIARKDAEFASLSNSAAELRAETEGLKRKLTMWERGSTNAPMQPGLQSAALMPLDLMAYRIQLGAGLKVRQLETNGMRQHVLIIEQADSVGTGAGAVRRVAP